MRKALNIDDLPADGIERDQFGFPILPKQAQKQEAGAPIQRIIGGYAPIEGMAGWYTREMTLRQEIELMDGVSDLQALSADSRPAQQIRAILPVAKLIVFRRNLDGDYIQATEDDILDNFRAAALMEIVKGVTGFGPTDASGDPTTALPTTATSSAG